MKRLDLFCVLRQERVCEGVRFKRVSLFKFKYDWGTIYFFKDKFISQMDINHIFTLRLLNIETIVPLELF